MNHFNGNQIENLADLNAEIVWIERIIDYQLRKDGNNETDFPYAPDLSGQSVYSKFVSENQFGQVERVLLGLAITSSWIPNKLIPFIEEADNFNVRIQYGGVIKDRSLNFVPTLRTALFLLSGEDEKLFAKSLNLLHMKHPLFTQGVIILENHYKELSRLKHQISLSDSFLEHFLTGNPPKLDEEENFPAKLSLSKIDFEDLVLSEACYTQLKDILKYLEVKRKLFSIEGVSKLIRSSYVAIFTGEPGTGKTITAKTIGKKLGIPVYVVNLARVVSKYIGETEKNLERVFDRFNNKDCILFFDEADALFGKRMEVKDSKDRYANQEVAFLLQKIEEFNGVVILASNVHDINQVLDKAFQRRIRRVIRFEFPEQNERFLLWKKALPVSFCYENGLNEYLSENYQLTGASISNIIADTLVEAVYSDTDIITLDLLMPAMEIEYKKTGRKLQQCNDVQAMQNPQLRYGVNFMKGDFG